MFELVLPPKAAKAAIPLLTVVTLAGFALLVVRPARDVRGALLEMALSAGDRRGQGAGVSRQEKPNPAPCFSGGAARGPG